MSTPFRLRLVDAHTGATFDGAYRNAVGPIAHVMDELCLFFRDRRSGGVINYDVGVIDFLVAVMAATGQTRAIVLSAFRSRETNEMLADVRFDTKLADAMATARAMKRGGVGWYPRSGFIHLDSGPVRNWDLGSADLQDLLGKAPPAPAKPAPEAAKPENGPGQLVVEGKTPFVVSARKSLIVR